MLGGPLEDERASPAREAAFEHAHRLDAYQRLFAAVLCVKVRGWWSFQYIAMRMP